MPNHLKVIALAVIFVVPGSAFALEDSYLPADRCLMSRKCPTSRIASARYGASGPRVRQERF